MKKLVLLLICIIIIGTAYLLGRYLIHSKPKPIPKEVVELLPYVDILIAKKTIQETTIETFGTVKARTQTNLIAEVPGLIEAVAPFSKEYNSSLTSFRNGGFFEKGDLLIKIEETDLKEYCFEPNKNLVNFCKEINIPAICFPKGLKNNYKKFINEVKPNAINIDQEIDPAWARIHLNSVCIQGGMDPEILLKNERVVLDETEKYLEIFSNHKYIFNLGHGIMPETDPENVKTLVKFVKDFK